MPAATINAFNYDDVVKPEEEEAVVLVASVKRGQRHPSALLASTPTPHGSSAKLPLVVAAATTGGRVSSASNTKTASSAPKRSLSSRQPPVQAADGAAHRAPPRKIPTAGSVAGTHDEGELPGASRDPSYRYPDFQTGAQAVREQRVRDAHAEREARAAELAAAAAAHEADEARAEEERVAQARELARLQQERADDAAAREALGLPPLSAGSLRSGSPLSKRATGVFPTTSSFSRPQNKSPNDGDDFEDGSESARSVGTNDDVSFGGHRSARTDASAPAPGVVDSSTTSGSVREAWVSRFRSARDNDALIEAQILDDAKRNCSGGAAGTSIAQEDAYEKFIASRTAAAVAKAAREARLARLQQQRASNQQHQQQRGADVPTETDHTTIIAGHASYATDAGSVGRFSTDAAVDTAVLRGTEDDPLRVADPVTVERQRFVAKETDEARQGLWLQLCVHSQVVNVLERCLEESRENQILNATFTPLIKRKLDFWRKRALRRAYIRSRLPFVRLPTVDEVRAAKPHTHGKSSSRALARLRDVADVPRCQFFAQWRERDIELLFTAAVESASREGVHDAALHAPTYRKLKGRRNRIERRRRESLAMMRQLSESEVLSDDDATTTATGILSQRSPTHDFNNARSIDSDEQLIMASAEGLSIDSPSQHIHQAGDEAGYPAALVRRALSPTSEGGDTAELPEGVSPTNIQQVGRGPMHAIEASIVAFRKGEYVYFSGDRATELYVVAHGVVDLIAVRDSRSKAESNGHVGDVIDAVLHTRSRVKRKSKGAENGVVVETLGPHGTFGDLECLFGGSRALSARCTEDTELFVFSRHTVFTFISSLPGPTLDELRRAARVRRDCHLAKSFPMIVADLRREPLFASWNVRALTDLAGAFAPKELRRGVEIDEVNQSLDLACVFVVTGLLSVTGIPRRVRDSTSDPSGDSAHSPGEQMVALPGAANSAGRVEITRITAGEWYGAEAVLLGHDVYDRLGYTNVRIAPLEDTALWILTKLAMSDVAIEHPVGVVESRDRINRAYATSLRQPTLAEAPAFSHDAILRYMCPLRALELAWPGNAKPRLLAPGDSLCKAGESVAAKHMLTVVVSGCVHVRSGPAVKRPASDYVVVRDTPYKGYVVGALEFGTRSSAYLNSINCVSTCRAWDIPAVFIESLLVDQFPLVWTRVSSDSCVDALLRRHEDGTLDQIDEELFRPADAANHQLL